MATYPLFPLAVVLFPGALIPLHIFEPRYRKMLADCAQGSHRFVLAPPGDGTAPPEPGAIGTVARIRAIQPLPDGRSNVVVSGDERVTLAEVVAGAEPYLIARVNPLEDLPDVHVATAGDLATLRSLADRYAAAHGVLADQERDTDLAPDPALATFQVAAMLEWDFEAKHRFLSVRSPHERVVRLLQVLPGLVQDLERRAQVHRRAASNGKGPH